MKDIGIDKIDFYIPHYYLELKTLGEAIGVSVDKYHKGLGQYQMAIVPPNEDVVTLGANAAKKILDQEDYSAIDTVLFATETGIDQSKAAGIYVHQLLGLPETCRVIELKQACYSATAALQMAISLVAQNPNRKILVIASDIAKYGFNTRGESSQGAGAVAMLISANPRLLAIESETAYITRDVMDFWRPNYSNVPIVDGKYSAVVYLDILKTVWNNYQKISGRRFEDHAQFCYHNSVPRLIERAHKIVADTAQESITEDYLSKTVQSSLEYGRIIGNCYTAALYLGIISTLDYCRDDLAQKRLGLFSYGSGCVGEYFSARVMSGYQKYLKPLEHQQFLAQREALTYENYKAFYSYTLPEDGSDYEIENRYKTGAFRLKGVEKHKRIYTSSRI